MVDHVDHVVLPSNAKRKFVVANQWKKILSFLITMKKGKGQNGLS